MKVIVLLAAFLSVARAWQCPTLSLVDPLDLSKFAGTWYQQGAFGTLLFQGFGHCTKAVYTLDSATNTLAVHNTQTSIFGDNQEISGSAVLADPTKTEGKLNVTLATPVGDQTAGLSVLATDYDNYAILYSCVRLLGYPKKAAWMMTRTQQLKGEEKTKVTSLMEDALKNIKGRGAPKMSDFWATSQDNC